MFSVAVIAVSLELVAFTTTVDDWLIDWYDYSPFAAGCWLQLKESRPSERAMSGVNFAAEIQRGTICHAFVNKKHIKPDFWFPLTLW